MSEAKRWTEHQRKILASLNPDADDEAIDLLENAASAYGLDPFRRQLCLLGHFDKRLNKKRWSILTTIDGLRAIANRTGQHAGTTDPAFDNDTKPTRATVTVTKLVGPVKAEFSATARWNEYYPGDLAGIMWRRMPCVMLGKCAEALALRKGFPEEMAGLYSKEEMDQAASVEPPHQSAAPPPKRTVAVDEPDERPIESGDAIAIQQQLADLGISGESLATFCSDMYDVDHPSRLNREQAKALRRWIDDEKQKRIAKRPTRSPQWNEFAKWLTEFTAMYPQCWPKPDDVKAYLLIQPPLRGYAGCWEDAQAAASKEQLDQLRVLIGGETERRINRSKATESTPAYETLRKGVSEAVKRHSQLWKSTKDAWDHLHEVAESRGLDAESLKKITDVQVVGELLEALEPEEITV